MGSAAGSGCLRAVPRCGADVAGVLVFGGPRSSMRSSAVRDGSTGSRRSAPSAFAERRRRRCAGRHDSRVLRPTGSGVAAAGVVAGAVGGLRCWRRGRRNRRVGRRQRRGARQPATVGAGVLAGAVLRNATNASTATPTATTASKPPAIAKWFLCRTIVAAIRRCAPARRRRERRERRRRGRRRHRDRHRCADNGRPERRGRAGDVRGGEHGGVLGR